MQKSEPIKMIKIKTKKKTPKNEKLPKMINL